MHGGAGVLVNDGVAVVTRGDTMLNLWSAAARLHRARWVFDNLDALLATQPEGIHGMIVILETSDPPDAATRSENFLRLRKVSGKLRRLVAVIVGDELHQTIVRTVLRLLALPLGTGRLVVERSIEAGLQRLRESAGPNTPSLAELRQDAEQLYVALKLEVPEGLRRVG